jgi:hypothetical protein
MIEYLKGFLEHWQPRSNASYCLTGAMCGVVGWALGALFRLWWL